MRTTLAWILLLLAVPALAAAADPMPSLPVAATDKDAWDARLGIGLTVDAGNSWQTRANLNQLVTIKATLEPAAVHVGKAADIFVVGYHAGRLWMLGTDDRWVAWSGNTADLKPVRDDVALAARQDFVLHEGGIRLPGRHQLYMGYRPAGGDTIIYTATGAAFDIEPATADPQTWFTDEIFHDIVLPRCALCHVEGGVAKNSGLRFIRDPNRAQENFDRFDAFYRQQDAGYDYVLGKVSGTAHGGGNQLPRGGADYQKMAAFLALLDGATGLPAPGGTNLFEGLRSQSAADTLRDAALLLAGRLPTAAETAAVTTSDDAGLKQVLLRLMQGEHFHKFLKDAANDRLFLRGNDDFELFGDCDTCFPALNAEYWRLRDAADASGAGAERRRLTDWSRRMNYSIVEAPLELIAYVVENDRPYSEVLTADYDMLTPLSNAAFGGTAVFPADANPVAFRPGRIRGYYLRDTATVVEPVLGALLPRMVNPGNTRIDYPHVGVLNSKSFLNRYPSTATNRNRARARWTYYNFLGVDVEALAARTTDPVALADTNNPTMNNPACAVCHTVLDPVAGAFQDYGDSGIYRTALNGTDSLDRVYKTMRGTPYRPGDTWYADMRAPGFEGLAASGANTTRWLAEQIVRDRRFAAATVQFWWPAVMGGELLKAPEVASDADYAARLAAYSAQQAELGALTDRFITSGLSLKQLLADMVVSRWFRSERRDSTNTQDAQAAARGLARLTGEKLLTPEQLARKTHALTGFDWNAQIDAVTQQQVGGLEAAYSTFYGGIDSFALKVRARTMTPLMANVAATHALETACPVVLGDFIRPDAQRLLFGALSPLVTPATEASITHTPTGTSATDLKPLTLTLPLQPGPKFVVMSLLNDGCNFGSDAAQCRAAKNLVVGSISIRAPDGRITTLTGDSAVRGNCAAATANNSLTLYSTCRAGYAFTAPSAGTYTVTAHIAALHTAADPVVAGMNIEAEDAVATNSTAGAAALKAKLIELHHKLLGQNLTPTSPELLASYDLLLQTWQERRSGNFAPALLGNSRMCEWWRDIGFIDTLGYPGAALLPNGRYDGTAVINWLLPRAQDPLHMKQSWVVVMAYLLSHYDYLHE